MKVLVRLLDLHLLVGTRSFVRAAVTAAAALGRSFRRPRRRTSPPSWLVGALRRLRALALAPSLAGAATALRGEVSTLYAVDRGKAVDCGKAYSVEW